MESSWASADPVAAVEEILAALHRDPGPAPLAERAEAVDRCFGHASLREIISALVEEGRDWSWEALEPIGDNSPTALAVTFRQLGEGAALDFDEAIRREYRITARMVEGREFFEGIRALVVDKDRKPDWRPQTIADIGDEALARHFAPLAGAELDWE